MAERLKMPDPLYSLPYSFLVYNISRVKCYLRMETLPNHALQHFNLHRPHELRIYLPQFFLPHNPKHRIFFLKLPEFSQHDMSVTSFRQMDSVTQHWL